MDSVFIKNGLSVVQLYPDRYRSMCMMSTFARARVSQKFVFLAASKAARKYTVRACSAEYSGVGGEALPWKCKLDVGFAAGAHDQRPRHSGLPNDGRVRGVLMKSN